MKIASIPPTPARTIIFWTLISTLFILAINSGAIFQWYDKRYNITLETLLLTAKVPLKGANVKIFSSLVPYLFLAAAKSLILLFFVITFDIKIMARVSAAFFITIKNKNLRIDFRTLYRIFWAAASLVILCATFFLIDQSIFFLKYIKKLKTQEKTYIYEEHYIDPKTVSITARAGLKPKNLLYIYLEAMETACAEKSLGGEQPHNLIPNLVNISNNNISFSNKKGFGGLYNTVGTHWTLGSIFSSSSGVPFSLSLYLNDNKHINGHIEGYIEMNKMAQFAPGITTLGDILKEKGYEEEFLCGSDGNFAGRKDFFQQHGDYKVFDYYTAIERGYIDKDYHVWWGFEDKILYEIAKDELRRLSKGSKPFNLTVLTVDTHFEEGYVCSLCKNNFPKQIENVISCADEQLKNFLTWCEGEDFFNDTLIVITGDHPRGDKHITGGLPPQSHTVFDCFINAYCDTSSSSFSKDNKVKIREKERVAVTFDLFPTVLYGLGFSIPGERLGLGTNLFSDKKTLAEELGLDALNKELSGYSQFYIDKFFAKSPVLDKDL